MEEPRQPPIPKPRLSLTNRQSPAAAAEGPPTPKPRLLSPKTPPAAVPVPKPRSDKQIPTPMTRTSVFQHLSISPEGFIQIIDPAMGKTPQANGGSAKRKILHPKTKKPNSKGMAHRRGTGSASGVVELGKEPAIQRGGGDAVGEGSRCAIS